MELIKGDTVTLRPIDEGDTDNIVKWRNLPSVKENLFTQDDITREQHLAWLNNKVKPGHCHQFIICLNENEREIGTVFIKNIDVNNKKGEFGIFLGEVKERGKGYGTETAKLVIKYAFDKLGLKMIYLNVFAQNAAAIKSYEKVGFKMEKYLNGEILREDKYLDVVYMVVYKK